MDTQQLRAARKAEDYGKDAGVWAGQPTLPLSGVDCRNTSGGPVLISINGGTVTAVKVNGVTITGMSWATTGRDWVRLRTDDVINITYNPAPTWQWFQE